MSHDHTTPIDEKDPADSFLRILPLLRAMAASKVRRPSESVMHVATVALGTVPHLRRLRPRILALPEFDAAVCDRLDDCALGLMHADIVWLSTLPQRDDLPDLLKEGGLLKLRLLRDAQALAQRGLIPAAALNNLAGYHGYREVADDLRCLRNTLKQNWTCIQDHTGVDLHELDYAEKLALCMDRLRGMRANPPSTPRDEARDLRARAFTLLVDSYRQIERAVDFLLWNEPSRCASFPPLFRGRPRKDSQSRDPNNLGVV